ncbi:uncharacterized protein RAG0_11590 [Rhynchosporium agropyri]|uniref:ATP adenylyltransferase C-terminal domain-containing protein n=1 Tax=Rhynchosporium agropyri TaxID=914238 RepID=A0A1E1L4Y5_9HELO|nr:uncharacterized protein RAG0_11590 [Rhynchosporium agropyri]
MRSGIEPGDDWEVLVDKKKKNLSLALPFSYFYARIPDNASPEQLQRTYVDIHSRACSLVTNSDAVTTSPSFSESSISYNLGFSDRAMILCPRVSEGLNIVDSSGNVIGPITLNGTILGGKLLVKSEEEWNTLRHDITKLTDILQSIGIATALEQGGLLQRSNRW